MKVCPICETELNDKDEFGSNHLCPNSNCQELVVAKEAETEEIEVPECWKYFDGRDNSCRKCKVNGYCAEAQANDRVCAFFGAHKQMEIECTVCLDASQCQEKQNKESSKMATVTVRKQRGSRRRGGRQQKKVQPKVASVVEEVEEVEEEESQDYGSMRIADLRELAKERDLDPKGRKSVLIQRLMADDEGLDQDEAEEEVEEKPTRRPAARQRRRKDTAKPDPVEEVTDEPEQVEVGGDVFDNLLTRLQAGEALTFSAVDGGWVVSAGNSIAITATTVVKKSGAGLKGRAFEEEAFSDEYFDHLYVNAAKTGKGWKELTVEERYAAADDIGADWEEHENSKTDQMRMGMAVRKALGIEKWKEEYKSRAAREALKDG